MSDMGSVNFVLNICANAPYLADKVPPFYAGDLCLRDGAARLLNPALDIFNPADILCWNGREWKPMGE